MKIQITTQEPAIEGYVWASPQNEKFGSNFFKCWEFCMEAQCSEIYAPNILNTFSVSDIEKNIPTWAKLLKPEGTMIVGGIDVYILAKAITDRKMSLVDINNMIFPNKINSFSSANYTKTFLNSIGLKVVDININCDNFEYTVKGVKGA